MRTLLANQKPRIKPGKRGYVYMIRVKDGVTLHDVSEGNLREVLVKIGMALQMQGRIDGYNTGFADKVVPGPDRRHGGRRGLRQAPVQRKAVPGGSWGGSWGDPGGILGDPGGSWGRGS